MQTNNHNHSAKKLHNPKAHTPSVYIPCWLIQVSNDHLSYAAKILYGRLAQWSNESGKVYRSTKQLAQEIGANPRTMEVYLKELRDVQLIGTFQPKKGGVNHFEFYDHEWMYAPINENLTYKSDTNDSGNNQQDPPVNLRIPSRESADTPSVNSRNINIKEIKRNKITNTRAIAQSVDKSFFLTAEDMIKDNPHCIDEQLINEWIVIRKKKKAPLTPTAWSRTNKTLNRLVDKGLNARDCFETMVANGWQGMEYRYFENELQPKKENKYPTHSERAANEQKIRQREIDAQRRKQEEIEASKKFNEIVKQIPTVSLMERLGWQNI